MGNLQDITADDEMMTMIADGAFEEADKDKSGFVEVNELKEMLDGMAKDKGESPPDDKAVEKILKKYDKDGNDKIDKEEFKEMIKSFMEEALKELEKIAS